MTASGLRHPPRGITVLEVLISIGILAIGLTSVLAIVPAAKSQSARAVILDRASALAANVLADAATFGLLRFGSDTLTIAPLSNTPVVIDAADGAMVASTASSVLKQTGIYGIGTTAAPLAFHQAFLQSRDDILFTTATTSPDDAPLNYIIDGARAFEGRMTSLLCLSGTGTGPCRASVVVFHARDPNLIGLGAGGSPLTTAAMTSGTLTLLTSDLRGRQLTDLIRPGSVAFVSGTFHQLAAATVINSNTNSTTTTATVFLTSTKDAALGAASSTITIQFLPDSVGLAERTFTPETAGAFTP